MAHNDIAVTGAAGPTLWSHGTKQYGVFVNSADNFVVCQFDRTTKALEASFALSGVSGNPLGVPLATHNLHRAAAIGMTPNGIIYVAGNMHSESTVRVVKTTGAGVDITVAANWVNAVSEFYNPADRTYTYPQFYQFAGSTIFTYTARSTTSEGNFPSGRRLFRHDGSSWTDLGFITHGEISTEDAFYFTEMCVEGPHDPHPNRGHWFGAWDAEFGGPADITVDNYSYFYTDDEGTTWRSIDGTALTTPISRTNAAGLAADTGITFGDPTTNNLYASGGGIDAAGYPCGSYIDRSIPRLRLIRWNGTSWNVDTTSFGGRYGGAQEPMPIRFRGDLWILARPLAAGDNTKIELRRAAAPNEIVHVGGPIGTGWMTYYDRVAFRETGVIEVLHTNDDVPRVVTAGNHHRARAA